MNKSRKDSRRDQRTTHEPQPLIPSTKEAFEKAYAETDGGTNIYGWVGDRPADGYYIQGGTLIHAFATQEEGGVCGFAV